MLHGRTWSAQPTRWHLLSKVTRQDQDTSRWQPSRLTPPSSSGWESVMSLPVMTFSSYHIFYSRGGGFVTHQLHRSWRWSSGWGYKQNQNLVIPQMFGNQEGDCWMFGSQEWDYRMSRNIFILLWNKQYFISTSKFSISWLKMSGSSISISSGISWLSLGSYKKNWNKNNFCTKLAVETFVPECFLVWTSSLL